MKKACLFATACLAIGGFVITGQAQEEFGFNARVYGTISPILGGDITGEAIDASYDELYDLGYGGGAELEYFMAPDVSFLLGAGYEPWDGDENEGVEAEDLDIVPLYVGVKYTIPWQADQIDLYLRGDLGAAYISDGEGVIGGATIQYWDSSWVFMGDIGIGAEYHFENFGVFLEVKGRFIDRPDAIGNFDVEGSWSLPVVLGATFRF